MIRPNTPAARAGLLPGLTITKINGVPTEGKSTAECLDLARGAEGTKVPWELVSTNGNQTNTVELAREKFQL
jgi:C-terminal processing protease CtpA/Prc